MQTKQAVDCLLYYSAAMSSKSRKKKKNRKICDNQRRSLRCRYEKDSKLQSKIWKIQKAFEYFAFFKKKTFFSGSTEFAHNRNEVRKKCNQHDFFSF